MGVDSVLLSNVVNIRDFKLREEQAASDERLAKQVQDTAPCELPGVWPDFYHAPDSDPA